MEGKLTGSVQNKETVLEQLFWVTGWVYDFSKLATFFLVVGLFVHYFLFSFLIVRGQSMMPSFNDGDVLLINKVQYLHEQPRRGDAIAMYWPGEIEKRFIKRIIGLPGETVKIAGGRVFIDGRPLNEPYLNSMTVTVPELERKLAAGEYFVLGDNRANSSDSRAWGPVPRSFIVGKVGFLPATRFDLGY